MDAFDEEQEKYAIQKAQDELADIGKGVVTAKTTVRKLMFQKIYTVIKEEIDMRQSKGGMNEDLVFKELHVVLFDDFIKEVEQ